jgi:predicted GIY-YIG superfamily endonuclease
MYHIYDDGDGLLYIGVSKHFGIRWQKHACTQPWWNEVRSQTVYWYDSRDEALDAEALAIFTEHPRHNVMHRNQAQRLKRVQRRIRAAAVPAIEEIPETTITLGPGVTQELVDRLDEIDRLFPETVTARPGGRILVDSER